MSRKIAGALLWARTQFGGIQLGDKRLNRRAMEVARAMAEDPSGSIPRQNGQWKNIKGAYRLFDHEKATFESLSEPNRLATRRLCARAKVTLMIQDTTWLDYSAHEANQGMGRFGRKRKGSGMFLHSVLAVEPVRMESGIEARVLGVAGGKLWARTDAAVTSRNARRYAKDRESLRWGEMVEQIGSPPEDRRWIHVGDRESDIYQLYEQVQSMAGVGFVVRVNHDRNACGGHDTPDRSPLKQRRGMTLKKVCRSMETAGSKRIWIEGKGGRKGRWAQLSVSGGPVTLWSPQLTREGKALRCWAVRVWEENPPEGRPPMEWMLLTGEPLEGVADILRIADYYALRWQIESYHQCLKSGCKVEESQLESADRLGPMIAIACAVAARLVQLRNDARTRPEEPAVKCVEASLVRTLAKLIRVKASSMSIRRFMRETAKLGGFIGRNADGEPGWRTLWQGWHQLSLIHRGRLLSQPKGDVGNG